MVNQRLGYTKVVGFKEHIQHLNVGVCCNRGARFKDYHHRLNEQVNSQQRAISKVYYQ